MNLQENIRRILREEDFIPLEDLYTVIKDYEDGFDVSIMNRDKKIGEISFAKENKPNQYTIVDATIDDEYKGNRIYPKTIINLFKERPNLIINSVFRSPDAEKAWIYLLSDLPSNIEHKVKYYEDEETTLYQLKLKNLQESIRRILKEEMEPGIFIEFIERMLEHFKKKDCICDIRVTFDVEDPDYNIYLVFSQEELHDKFLNLYRIRSYIQEMRDEVKMQLEVFLPIRNIFVGYYTKPNCEWSPLNESKGKKEDYFLKLINDLIQRVKSTNNNICDMWVEYNSEDGDYEIRSSSPIRYYQLHDSGLSDVLSLIDNTISSWGLNVYVFAPYYVENCGDKIEYINESKLSGNTNLQKKVIDLIKSNGVNVAVTALGDFLNLFKILDINSPMEFLHLFNDLDVVQSEEKPDWTLLRYKPKHNLMIHNKKNDNVYINYDEIWKFLEDFFNLKYSEIKELIEEWLFEVYNLRGITPDPQFHGKGWGVV